MVEPASGTSRRKRKALGASVRRLYLFVVSARPPGEGQAAPPRVLLVFVRATAFDAAAETAQGELHRRGWSDAELQGAKELPTDPAAEAEPYAREAIEKALAEGFAFIAYL
jgi:hypothetical protein